MSSTTSNNTNTATSPNTNGKADPDPVEAPEPTPINAPRRMSPTHPIVEIKNNVDFIRNLQPNSAMRELIDVIAHLWSENKYMYDAISDLSSGVQQSQPSQREVDREQAQRKKIAELQAKIQELESKQGTNADSSTATSS